ncbi:MAG: hypothetical protein JWR04_1957 [Rhodoglobus sp.]|nr:hypothetical protein [Rhodoglobus sp.]
MDGLAHLRREAPVHALMLGVMAGAMLSHSPFASIAGAALLVVVSVPCAALSRSRTYFRAHVVDLWAMALVLLAFVPSHPVGHHAVSVPVGWAFAVVVTAWAGVRVWLGMHGSGVARRAAAASGGLTALGLVAMGVLCS